MLNIQKFVESEANVIDKTLANHGIDAGVLRGGVSFITPTEIHYLLGIGKAERISRVRRVVPELRLGLCNWRQDAGLLVRLDGPPLSLIARRPDPVMLDYKSAPVRDLRKGMAMVGRSYGYKGATSQTLSLDNAGDCQVLIAGTTGSGKSTLQRVMLASLLSCTHPEDMEVLLVDLKNEDLQPFRSAPHVRSFSGDLSTAGDAIAYVYETLKARVIHNEGRRILVVLDELSLLNFGDRRVMEEWLPQIVSAGRSKRIHVWAATQHPLTSIVGSVIKANFPVRIVGQVTDATASNVALGVKGREAHLLPGPGAFLFRRNGKVRSMQAYNMDAAEVPAIVKEIVCQSSRHTISLLDKPAASENVGSALSPLVSRQTTTETDAETGLLPYSKPVSREAIRLCKLVYQTKGSKNRAIIALWPNRNKVKCKEWLDEALAFDLSTQKIVSHQIH